MEYKEKETIIFFNYFLEIKEIQQKKQKNSVEMCWTIETNRSTNGRQMRIIMKETITISP